jgi:hypothetical protein
MYNSGGSKLYGLDELGTGVSIYFKLIKSLISLFLFLTLLSTPIYYVFSCGNISNQATSSLQKHLSEWTLGNIGESSF